MDKITNHNCAGLCEEQFCDNIETQFIKIDIHGMKFLIGFCDKHAEEFEDKIAKESDRRVELKYGS